MAISNQEKLMGTLSNVSEIKIVSERHSTVLMHTTGNIGIIEAIVDINNSYFSLNDPSSHAIKSS